MCHTLCQDPNYAEADTIVITFIIDNYDAKSNDPFAVRQLEKALLWEEAFIHFMKNWTSNEENMKVQNVVNY